MAKNNQNESPLPIPGNKKITSADFLPRFFRTEANKKFLQGTLDQLIKPGVAEKINGYVGSKAAKGYNPNDNYLGDVSAQRENYQLEPAVVVKDSIGNVDFYKDYNDYINQLSVFGANTENHSRLNSQHTYSWNPHIDFDKFTNFREYYWLPSGPLSVPVTGQSREVVSTYSVTVEDQGDNFTYVFNDGFVRNPTLKLYRGQTYKFDIDTPGHPIAFAITRNFTPGAAILTAGTEGLRADGLFGAQLYGNEYDQGDFIILPSGGSVTFEEDENVSTLYPDGIRKLGEEGEEIAVAYVEKGTIEFTIPANSPDRLYYVSKNNIDTSGLIRIYDIEENTFLNVEEEVLNKKTYKSGNDIEFSNGMKVQFLGDVVPEKYSKNQWYVEGVGDKIRLVRDEDLTIPSAYSEDKFIPYDTEEFDKLPFSNASAYPVQKDYIVINRASKDRNPWSRYNRWFHRSVVEQSFEKNHLAIDIDEESRAKRPIIEFEEGLKLYNSGVEAKLDVDLVDTFTKDVFSTIEGQIGYNIDGIDIADGMRILFTADTDILVSGKIYEVNFINIGNNRQISLLEIDDSQPNDLETVFVTQGNTYAGTSFHYENNIWKVSQEKTQRNQEPLFDLCCPQGNFYSDLDVFDSSSFKGTKIFSYKKGTGSVDTELGFSLTYRSIVNTGDILFDFNLLNDSFTVQTDENTIDVTTDTAYLRKYKNRSEFDYVNAWSSTAIKSKQYAVRQYDVTSLQNNNFEIDVYNRAGDLNDLKVIVYLNNVIKKRLTDYEIDRFNGKAFVRFYNELDIDDVVIIKTDSKTVKNENGYYEFPINLERNPLNQDMTDFTLGEVIDHVGSSVEELRNFDGVFPGNSNLRDLGNTVPYGKRFVKHAGPITLPLYHITNKPYNIVKALRHSKNEYSRFKRNFIDTATNLGYDGITRLHLDKVLEELNKDKVKSQSYYFSDMIGYGPSTRIEYIVLDSRIQDYALNDVFTLSELSAKSVNIYLNGNQLVYKTDYNFEKEGFVSIFANQQEGDIIEIYEYVSTDGSFISPTPSKLGLYPAYEPEITFDDTFQTELPKDNTAYKIYGQVDDERTVGWFYPVYTTKEAAQNADESSQHVEIKIRGLNRVLFMPANNQNIGAQENVEITTYPNGISFVRGHDGSYIRAYLDYRDNLLLELEKRIYNNIKIEFDNNIINVYDFIGGDFRESEFTKQEIDASLLTDFTQWLSFIDNDYTDNYFYDRLNDFTYNYSEFQNVDGKSLSGFWRGVFKRAFDTDRPHSHPWEMLGFTVKPRWWNEVYGPAPYTGDNLVLWRDLEAGKIAEPEKARINEKFARPGLVNFIPVDGQGNLKSPLKASYVTNFIQRRASINFNFGDEAPVETAWRRSSEYPFALITSMLLNKPAEIMGAGFDLSRIEVNYANQKVYADTNKHLNVNNLLLPNTSQDDQRILTSGFVNYVYNLIASDVLKVYDDYKTQLSSITNQIGFKLAGFSDKQKLNIILDSRSPEQVETESGIYVPQENYKIFLNTSSPVEQVTYSGIAIEKVPSGYVVRGYNSSRPFFTYLPPVENSTGVTVTVGGISENTVTWAPRKTYQEGQIVVNNNAYYRVTDTFTSAGSFDTNNLVKIPELPIVGGRAAQFYKTYNNDSPIRIPYGTKFNTSQEVVNFLLGHGQYLESQGFKFENFDNANETIDNWKQAAREFLFWTTQGWATGTVITLSPAANQVFFDKEYVVVDNLNDNFYEYSILRADGQPLEGEFKSLLRDENSFGVQTVGTDDGLYHLSMPLVQKEHVVLFDNKTVFNDVIYQPTTGYKQDRIKVTGYRAADWNGGLNIPGFVYDDASYTEWAQWKDYVIGDIVKYKQYYYVAKENTSGSKDFQSSKWYQLNSKPESELVTNFDYRINQITDFYDLDSTGFDKSQQEFAQHLIGYQKRNYLANIIPDENSQFKFYRGFIADKGTMNALTNLFDALGQSSETLKFYEEWAIQAGRYGSVNDIEQVEFLLDEDKFQESPQSFELLEKLPETNYNKIYRIQPFEVYDKPADYDNNPFPTKVVESEFVRTSGYLDEDDVDFVVSDIQTLSTSNVNTIGLGDTIWVVNTPQQSWTVYQLERANVNALELRALRGQTDSNGNSLYEVTIDKWAKNVIYKDDLIGIKGAQEWNVTGIFKVDSTNLNKVIISVSPTVDITNFEEQEYTIVKLRTVRVENSNNINDVINQVNYDNQRIWVDKFSTDNSWRVLENNPVYENRQSIINEVPFDSTLQQFGKNIVTTDDNNNVFISASDYNNGIVNYYRRTKETFNLQLDQEITIDNEFVNEWQPNTTYVKDAKIVYKDNAVIKYYIAKSRHTSGEIFDINNWDEASNPSEFLDSYKSNFGKSISVSPDGEYLAIGIPNASGIKTNLIYNDQGTIDFDPNKEYSKNNILRFRETLWKANRTILPQIAKQPFSTFDTYINIANATDADSTTLNLLVSGNPGLDTNNITNMLVRAPTDMYIGTKAGDLLTLSWLTRSFAYPTLDTYLPFDGEIPEITPEFLSNTHEILEKIDHVLNLETFITLPSIGDIVTTDTGSASVAYVATKRDSAVLYLKDTNGIFQITGELFIEEEDFVGLYTEESTYSTSSAVAGFWMIATPSYSNNARYFDTGRGLVYADIRLTDFDYDTLTPGIQLRNENLYYNVQNTIDAVGNYVNKVNQSSFITHLSYFGDPANGDAQSGVEAAQESDLWVVRVGKDFSDIVETGDELEFRVYDLDNRIVDLEAAGFPEGYDTVNKLQTIYDKWDGFVDFDLTRFDFEGFPFQPQVGDIIEDVQTPKDGLGGLALTSSTTSSLEITFIQRNFNTVRAYGKIVPNTDGTIGSWQELNNIGRIEIRRRGNENIRGEGDVDRVVGTINDFDNDVRLGTSQVGQLLIFQAETFFNIVSNPEIEDEEYYFFNENTEQGIQRSANPPYSLNKDYTQIYNIPASISGTSSTDYDNEGAVALYRRLLDGTYRFMNIFVSEYRSANRQFGDVVRLTQDNSFYTLFVGSVGDETRGNAGTLEIFTHGVKTTDNFKGDYKFTSYERGDIVIYQDRYYRAKKDLAATDTLTINNPLDWVNISWKYGKDDNFRGVWDNTYSYALGNIVIYNNTLYRANTNVAASIEFTTDIWSEIDTNIDYIGYLPNLTGKAFYNEDVFDPADNIIKFANAVDVSKNGKVLVVTSKQVQSDSTEDTKIAIYRTLEDQDNKFILSQVIDSPVGGGVDDWAENVSLNPQGTKLAISSRKNDSNKVDQGIVHVYEQQDGQFVLVQELTPPNNEETEQFGYKLEFGDNNLIISSLNGDQKVPTIFDNQDTTFDNDFTSFRNVKIDKGVVYVFEEVDQTLVYSEKFIYPVTQSTFGESIHVNNNHVYVGLPSQITDDLYQGTVVNFRKPKGVSGWNVIKRGIIPVDVDKISGAFLYNKKSNKIISYIDYVDPIQGKIAGPADQEITYKVPFDPAVYNTGSTSDYRVDADRYWADEYVGKVWWNIATAKFVYPYQGTTTKQKNNWNSLSQGASIDVYEWVESDVLPSTWDNIASTDQGVAQGISGISLYGNSRYTTKITYDEIAQAFNTKFYFWVQGKKIVPNDRKLSSRDIARLIADPRAQGYKFISFLDSGKFVLNNCETLVNGKDVVLNIKVDTGPEKDNNVHSQYQILTENLKNSKPDPDLERKWFDSLIGTDTNNRSVPDVSIPVSQRHGIQNTPRQGMFVNRVEALKQYIERVNLVLKDTLVIDEYNTNKLFEKEDVPSVNDLEYDLIIDTEDELRFVSTNKVTAAVLTPIITNGRITRIEIVDPGRGYKSPPKVTINGTGKDVDFNVSIDNLGSISSIEITNEGSGYNNNTLASVRAFTVLVNADNTVFGKWALYSWDSIQKTWYRRSIQDYDVSAYWKYIDWYDTGYNQFTNINFEIEGSYELTSLDDKLNDIVKIKNVGSGGWLLLRKIDNQITDDYTINYDTIGRENGTIQFTDNLYDYNKNTVGFDNRSFDSYFYDNNPSTELRIIFETIRDDLLIKDIEVEYNKLFFASLRYILSEQQSVDWMFKTSFVKVDHKVGDLEQDITFNANTLPSYESYVEEAKPYSTKIREFVNSYTSLDNTNSSITDFDLAPEYNIFSKAIEPSKAVVIDGIIQGESNSVSEYPRKHWKDNLGYSVVEIILSEPGSNYTFVPTVKLESDIGSGAVAKAFLGYGKITKIEVTYPGSGYITAPTVVIEGPQVDNGVPAKATAVLGDGLVRTPTIKMKFDRNAGIHTFEDLAETETFTGTGTETRFFLEWPMDIDLKKVSVSVDGVEQLRSKYTFENIENTDKSYTREQGKIIFTNPPALGTNIEVNYYKPLTMLGAEDRIKFAYNPISGMFGKDLAQLMTGVDYGGVEVKSFDFGGTTGWDAQGWYTDTWDSYDTTFEDEIFVADGSTFAVELSKPLEEGVTYNIYKNGVRIDDPNFNDGNPTNVNAVCNSITGDGETTIINIQNLNIFILDNDVLIIRKITSDGSVIPDGDSYDTALSGGDLAYSTAAGINAEEIIVDGDGFVTPTTSSGPEELVPGQVLDTLDIKVYTRDSGGQGAVYNQNYIVSNEQTEYDLGAIAGNNDSIFVKVNDIILSSNEYTIDWSSNTITIPALTDGDELNILTKTVTSEDILDFGQTNTILGQSEYDTTIDFIEGCSIYVTINGDPKDVILFENEDTGKVAFRFDIETDSDDILNYVIFSNDAQVNYSQVTKSTFTSTGSNTFELAQAPFYSIPSEHNVMIKVGNKILNPGYNIKYEISELGEREFKLESFQQPAGSLIVADLRVFLNGVEIQSPIDWRFDIANSSLVIGDEIGVTGDILEIYAITDGEYRITGNTITLDVAPAMGETVDVYQFSNHNILQIERINYDVVAREIIIPEDINYITYNRLTVGEITLRKPAQDAEYVWVSLNNELLTPSVDYYVTDDKKKVRLLKEPALNDVIDVLHMTAIVNIPKFSYRQFKDMLNRTHYKRLDAAVTTLAQDLNYYDLRIEVEDGSNLSEPNKSQNMPGVVFINGERIEYFVKEDNTLRQLRRGTLGTGVKNIHIAETKVYDQNISKTVPYRDQNLVQNFTADGITNSYEIEFNVGSVNEIEVFVAGTRLRKNAISIFSADLALDSPEGDIEVQEEFNFDTETNTLILTNTPLEDTKVTIIKKVGKIWQDPELSLAESNNSIARFLRAGTSELPE